MFIESPLLCLFSMHRIHDVDDRQQQSLKNDLVVYPAAAWSRPKVFKFLVDDPDRLIEHAALVLTSIRSVSHC